MKSEQGYKKSMEIVREAVHRLDPYSLIEGGCPEDQFDSEIRSITRQLDRCKSGRDIAHAIARTFTSSYGEKFQPSDFELEGENVYAKLRSISRAI